MARNIQLSKVDTLKYREGDCIICQKSGNTVSTENDRRNIINAAVIHKDDVLSRINFCNMDAPFSYHMSNQCYKQYTMKKTLEKITVSKGYLREIHWLAFLPKNSSK